MNYWDKLEHLKKACYIKLGAGGHKFQECRDEGTIYIGYGTEREDRFQLCMDGRWDDLGSKFIARNNTVDKASKAVATNRVNQIRHVFEDDGSTLWITFHDRKMWWCFSDPSVKVFRQEDKGRDGSYRKALTGWSCLEVDERGNASTSVLNQWQISGRISQVAAYKGTVRSYDPDKRNSEKWHVEYLSRRIRGKPSEELKSTQDDYEAFALSLAKLIRLLTHREFEALTELIFTSSGWRRNTELGKTMNLADLELEHMTSGLSAMVQIKSKDNPDDFERYFSPERLTTYDYMYWVRHTSNGAFEAKVKEAFGPRQENGQFPSYYSPNGKEIRTSRVYIVDDRMLAEMAIDNGLAKWIFQKVG